ncbi:MAG: thiamine diphosphokinase [bacterium]|nr:thiamine diphosphokinase [bacterium]MDE0601256.1 thiamine diphosphokinase [bacterium]
MTGLPPGRRVAVFAGGDSPPVQAARWIPGGTFVIAADSGLDHAHRLGFDADLLVGDLDSVSLGASDRHRGEVEEHSEHKDHTDLELALEAGRRRADVMVVVGGHGGRLDHLLANAELLGDHRWAGSEILWLAGEDLATVVRHRATLHGRPGDLVSLIPVGGHAIGVTTKGLQWSLQEATLAAGSTRGVSNRLTGTVAELAVRQGVLLAVQPGAVLTGPGT